MPTALSFSVDIEPSDPHSRPSSKPSSDGATRQHDPDPPRCLDRCRSRQRPHPQNRPYLDRLFTLLDARIPSDVTPYLHALHRDGAYSTALNGT
ncbi:hypothetical protein [Micromonospora sp. NPDC023888]|uniref:hypothetical protein n=1 Tax=Micromonospora sp. NPDC023888 TaxID=3155607 RepID=UPI0033D6C870